MFTSFNRAPQQQQLSRTPSQRPPFKRMTPSRRRCLLPKARLLGSLLFGTTGNSRCGASLLSRRFEVKSTPFVMKYVRRLFFCIYHTSAFVAVSSYLHCLKVYALLNTVNFSIPHSLAWTSIFSSSSRAFSLRCRPRTILGWSFAFRCTLPML